MGNLYEILGVSSRASQQEIRSAFRKLARQFHPDVNPSPTATEDFRRIANAYRILNDRRLRSLYDRGMIMDREEVERRRQHQQAVQRQVDAWVAEFLRKDQEETNARQVAVTTVVSLFFSTFLVALMQPPIFELSGWFGRGVCIVLFALGIRELIRNVRTSLEHYTYSEEMTVSVLRSREVVHKPYTRTEALVFLIGGYIGSLVLGLVTGQYATFLRRVVVDGPAVVSLFLLPPIAVLIVGRLRALGEKGELQ